MPFVSPHQLDAGGVRPGEYGATVRDRGIREQTQVGQAVLRSMGFEPVRTWPPLRIGLDVHREFAQVAIWERGQVRQAGQIATTPEALRLFADSLCEHDEVAIEATCNTYAIARLLERVARVVVSNPQKTRAIAEAKVKTDKVDAAVLAELLAADYLPGVWLPDEATHALVRGYVRLGARERRRREDDEDTDRGGDRETRRTVNVGDEVSGPASPNTHALSAGSRPEPLVEGLRAADHFTDLLPLFLRPGGRILPVGGRAVQLDVLPQLLLRVRRERPGALLHARVIRAFVRVGQLPSLLPWSDVFPPTHASRQPQKPSHAEPEFQVEGELAAGEQVAAIDISTNVAADPAATRCFSAPGVSGG
jgi:hypothetical protein